MRNLPPSGSGHGGGSAFADFISRLRPYPLPPDFQTTLLYAAGGAILLLVAGLAVSGLPTDLEGNGFHAIGASALGSVLEVFRVPAPVFFAFGLAGLAVTVVIGTLRRVGEFAGGILAALTMIGVAAALWTAAGWLLFLAVTTANLVLWLAVLASIPIAGFLVLRGQFAAAVVTLVIALVVGSALNQAASDPATSGGSQSAGPSQEAAAPPPVEAAPEPEPPPVPPAVEQQQEEAELRQQRRQQKREAFTKRRLDLEDRMDAEYAGWPQVAYVPPCDAEMRRAELGALREAFAEMKQRLRSAARYGEPGVFRKAAGDLERVARERERALADPSSIYEQFGRCPSGAGAMAFGW